MTMEHKQVDMYESSVRCARKAGAGVKVLPGGVLPIAIGAVLWGAAGTARAAYTWNGNVDTNFANSANWSSGIVGPTIGTYGARLSVQSIGATGAPIYYTSVQGYTTYTSNPTDSNRGLFIANGTGAGGTIYFVGGTFETRGTGPDGVGNSAGSSGRIVIDGGTYMHTNTTSGDSLLLGFSAGTGVLTVNSGTGRLARIVAGNAAGGTGRIELNGGVLEISDSIYGNTGNGSLYFNGGTLRAAASTANLLGSANLQVYVTNGGAVVDSAGFNPTIALSLKMPPSGTSGGLTKVGAGTLTLGGSQNNTYTGLTTVAAGALDLSKPSGIDAVEGPILVGGGTLKLVNANQIADTVSVTLNDTAAEWLINSNSETVDSVSVLNTSVSPGLSAGLQTGSGGSLTVTNRLVMAGGQITVNSGTSTITANSVTNTGGAWVFGVGSGAQTVTVGSGGLTIGNGSTITIDDAGSSNNAIILGGDVTSVAASTPNYIIGGTTGTGAVRLVGTRTFSVANGSAGIDLSIGASLQNGGGASALVQTGSGTMELTGNNTYTGGTVIVDAGARMKVSGSMKGNVTLGNGSGGNAYLDLGADEVFEPSTILGYNGTAASALYLELYGHSQTIKGFSETGDAERHVINNVNGSGVLTVDTAGSDTAFYGKFRTDGGTLGLAKDGLGTLTFNISATSPSGDYAGGLSVKQGVFSFSSLNEVTANGPLGRSTVTLGTAGDLTKTGTVQYTGGTATKGRPLVLADGGVGRLLLSAGSLTLTGTISGAGAFVKSGSPTLTLTASNSYNGFTWIDNNGILIASNSYAIGSTGDVIVASGAKLLLGAGVVVTGKTVTVSGSHSDNLGALTAAAGQSTWAGDIVIGADQTRIGTDPGGNLAISGSIGSGANNFGPAIRASSGSTVLVSGASTYLGKMSIVVGTVKLDGGDDRLPVGSALELGNGSNVAESFFDLNGRNQRLASLTAVGSTMTRVVTNTSATLSTLTISNAAAVTFGSGATIRGNIRLAKQGAGVFTLSGANEFTGGTMVHDGTLRAGNSQSIGSAAVADLAFGPAGTGIFQLFGNNVTVSALNSDAAPGTSAVESGSGTAGTDVLTINNAASSTYGGILRNGSTRALAIHKQGAGVLTLTGTNTLTGTFTLYDGTLRLGSTNALGPSSSALVTFTGSSAAVLQLNGNDVTLVQLISSLPIGSAAIESGGAVAGTDTLTINNTGTQTYDGELRDGGTRKLAFVKENQSTTFILGGTNTHSGGTFVNHGTLRITGSIAGNATVGVGDANNVNLELGRDNALDSSGTLTLNASSAGASFLKLRGKSQTLTSIALVGDPEKHIINNGLGGSGTSLLTFDTSAGDIYFGSKFRNDGAPIGLIKDGAGLLTFNIRTNSSSGDYSGGLFVRNGTMAVTYFNENSADGALGRSNIVLGTAGDTSKTGTLRYTASASVSRSRLIDLAAGGEGALDVTNTGTAVTLSGVIGGAGGSLTKLGAGKLTLTGPNTFSGNMGILGGVVNATALDNLGAGTATLIDGGELEFGGVFDPSARTMTFRAGGATLDTQGNDVTLANSVGNAGAGALTKLGTGRLILAAANTFTGNLNINEGTVVASVLNSLGAGTGVAFNGGELEFGGVFDPSVRTMTFTSNGLIDTAGNDITFANSVGNGAPGGLVKNGAGALSLAAANTYAGTTTLAAGGGTLRLGNPAAAGAGSTLVLNDGLLDLAIDASVNAYNTTVGGNVIIAAGRATAGAGLTHVLGTLGIGANTLTVTNGALVTGGTAALQFGATTLAADGTVFAVATNVQLTLGAVGQSGGTRSVTKAGEGTLLLSAAGTFAGGVTINGGAVRVGNATALGPAATATVTFGAASNGRLGLDGFNVTVTGLDGDATALVENGNASAASTLTVNNGSSRTFSGLLRDGGSQPLHVTKNGAGTLTLAGASTYSGATIINDGTLSIDSLGNVGGAPSSLGTPATAGAGAIVINAGRLRYTGAGHVSDRDIDITNGNGQSTVEAAGTGSLTVRNVTGAHTFIMRGAGTGVVAGVIDATAGNIRKLDSGRWTLTGTNTYNVTTLIEGGTLALAGGGSISNSGTISVNFGTAFDVGAVTGGYVLFSNQTLRGNGSVLGNVTVADRARIRPGGDGTIGTITFSNNLTLAAGATNIIDWSTLSNDVLTVVDTLAPGGSIIAINPLATLQDGVYTVATYGAVSGPGFNPIAVNTAGGGKNLSVSDDAAGRILVTVSDRTGAILYWNSPSDATWNVAGVPNWSNSVTGLDDVFYNGDPVVFDDRPGVQTNVVVSGTAQPSLVTVTTSTNSFTIAGGAIGSSGRLVKEGSSTLRLTGANTYAGGTLVSAGVLAGDSVGLQGSITNHAAVVFDQLFNGTYAGAMSGSGTLTKMGFATLTFGGSTPNTFTGLTTVADGILALGKNAGVDALRGDVLLTGGSLSIANNEQINNAAAVTLNGAGVNWTINGRTETVGSVNLINSAGIPNGLQTGSGGDLVVTGLLAISGGGITFNSGGSGASITADGVLATGGSWVFGISSGATQELFVGASGLTLGNGTTIPVIKGPASDNAIHLAGNLVSLAASASNGLSGSGKLTLNGARSFVVADGSAGIDLHVGVVVADGTAAGTLVKEGPGVMTLAGTSTYTGPTFVSNGLLVVDGFITSAVTVASGARLTGTGTVNGPAASTVRDGGSIGHVGGFAPGTLALNTLTLQNGSTVACILNGTTPGLNVTAADGLTTPAGGTSRVDIIAFAGTPVDGATYTLINYSGNLQGGGFGSFVLGAIPAGIQGYLTNNTGSTTIDLVITNTGGGLRWVGNIDNNWDIQATTNWQARVDGSPSLFYPFMNVLFDDGAARFTVTVAQVVSPGAMIFSNEANAYALAGQSITGGASLIKYGAATLFINSTNTYTGTTHVHGGRLSLGNRYALGATSAGTFIAGGGTLDFGGAASASSLDLGSEIVTIEGSGVNGFGAVVNDGAFAQPNALRYLALSGDATVGGQSRWDVRGGSVALNGYTLTKVGPNDVPLTDGPVSNGHLVINQGSMGFIRNDFTNGSITVNAPGRLYFNDNAGGANGLNVTVPITMNGGVIGTEYSGSDGTTTLGSPVTVNADVVISLYAGHPMAITNVISGPGGVELVTADNSWLTFTADNTYEGGTVLSTGGNLRLGQGGTAGSVTGDIVVQDPASAVFYWRSDAITLVNNITGAGDVYVRSIPGLTVNGSAGIQVGDTVGVGNNFNGHLNVAAGASISAGRVVLGSTAGVTGTVQQSGGTVTATNAGADNVFSIGSLANEVSTYVMGGGVISVPSAVIDVGRDGIGVFSVTGGQVQALGIAVDARTATPAYDGQTESFNLAGGTVNLGATGLVTAATDGGYRVNLGGGTLGALASWASSLDMNLTGTNGSVTVNSSTNTITFSGALSGTGGLVKTGDGLLMLDGTNTFSGGLAVSAGRLWGSGSIAAPVSIQSGASLGPATFTVPGPLRLQTLQMQAGGRLSCLLAGTNPTVRVASSGGLTAASSCPVDIVLTGSLDSVVTGTNVLVDYEGAIGGDGAGAFTLAAGLGGVQGYLSNDTVNARLLLVVTNIAPVEVRWMGFVNGRWDVNGTSNWLDGVTHTVFLQNNAVMFDDTASTFGVNVMEEVQPASVVVSNAAQGYAFNGAPIAGAGGLVKQGAGTLTIGNDNTYQGLTRVYEGVVVVSNSGGLGSAAAGTIVSNNAVLQLNGDLGVLDEPLTLYGTGIGGSGALRSSGQNQFSEMVSVSGTAVRINSDGGTLVFNVNVGSALSGGANLLLGGNGNITVSDPITIGAGTLVKDGTGLLRMNGASSYTGGTIVSNGILQIDHNGNEIGGGLPAGRPVIVQTNATVRLVGFNAFGIGSANPSLVTVNGGTLVTISGSARSDLGALQLQGGLVTSEGGTGDQYGKNILDGDVTTLASATTSVIDPLRVSLRGGSPTAAPVTFTVADGPASIDLLVAAQLIDATNFNLGRLVKTGAGRMALTGTNLYNGYTTILGGVLQVGTNGTSGTLGAGPVTNNGSLVLRRSDAWTLGNTIVGTGTVTHDGAGTLALTAQHSYTGQTVVSAGILNVNGSLSPASPVIVESGGRLGGGGTAGVVNVKSGGTIAGGNGAGAGTSILTVKGLALGDSASATSFVAVTIGSATGIVSVVDAGQLTVQGAAVINVAGVISDAGTYDLIRYTGASPGLSKFSIGSLPAGAAEASLQDSGSAIRIAITKYGAKTWVGGSSGNWDLALGTEWKLDDGSPAVFNQGDLVLFDTNALDYSVNVAASVAPSAMTIAGSSNYLFTGSGGIAGSGTVTMAGSGTATLATSNSHQGTLVISSGTLQLGGGGPVGSIASRIVSNRSALVVDRSGSLTIGGVIAGTGSVSLAGTATVILTNNNTLTGPVTISSGTLQVGAGGSAGTAGSSPIAVAGTLSLFRNNAQTIDNAVSGAGVVQVFSAASSYRDVEFNGDFSGFTGVLNVWNTARIVDGGGTPGLVNADVVVQSGGQFVVGAHTYAAQSMKLYGDGQDDGALRVDGATYTGPVTLATNAAISPYGNVATVSGDITGAFELQLRSAAGKSGVLTLSGNNAYGSTLITKDSGGSIAVIAGSATALSPGPMTLSGGTLKLNGHNLAFASLSGSSDSQIQNGSASSASVLTVGTNDASTTFSGVLLDGGAPSLALVKRGAGTLTLAGENLFTGGTVVSNGALFVNGSLYAEGSLRMGTNTALGGKGSLGNVTMAPGRLLPGATAATGSVGSLRAQSLDVTGPVTYEWGITNAGQAAGTGWDLIAVSNGAGVVNLPAGQTITVNVSCALATLPGFDNAATNEWLILSAGTVNGFASNNVAIVTNGFAPDVNNGAFRILRTAAGIALQFIPGDPTDLAVGLSQSTEPVALGASITYTVSITNQGPNASGTYYVTNILGAGVSYVSSSSGGTHSGGRVSWTLSGLTNGGVRTLLVNALAPAVEGVFTNTVTVTPKLADIDPSDNVAALTNTAACGTGSTPVITAANHTFTESIFGSFSVQAVDPGCVAPVSLVVTGLPAGAVFNVGVAGSARVGTFNWIPTSGQIGTHPVRFIATDAEGLSNSVTVRLYVRSSSEATNAQGVPLSQTNWHVAITNLLVPSSGNATVVWESVSGIAYDVYRTPNTIGAGGTTWTLVETATADGTNMALAVTPGTTQQFYQVVLAGGAPDSNGVWGVITPTIHAGVTFFGAPLAGDRALNGEFGASLAEMLTGHNAGVGDMNGDELHIYQTNATWASFFLDVAGQWRNGIGGEVATNVLAPGQGVLVLRFTSTVKPSFSGPVGNDGRSTNTLFNGWNVVALSEGRALSVQSAFGNTAEGSPTASYDETQSDLIAIYNPINGSWKRLQRIPGMWLDLQTFAPANLLLMPGQAVYYFRQTNETQMKVRF